MPEISVIIPCYNQGQYIDEAVNSVLSQTFQDFEIIIVNDGSTDKYTVDLLNNFDRQKSRVIHTSNLGLASARNTGIMASSGKFILPLDADDKISKYYLDKAYEILIRESDIGILYCEAKLFGKKWGKWNLPEYSLNKILLKNMIFASSFFKKEDWQRVGGYKSNMISGWEDWDLWLSIIGLGRRVYKIPEVFFYYRIRGSTMSRNLSKHDYIKLHTQLFNNHQELFIDNIESIFSEIYNIKCSWFYKIGMIFHNPRRLIDKLFRI